MILMHPPVRGCIGFCSICLEMLTTCLREQERVQRFRAAHSKGSNDFKKAVYGGPCPPQGQPHRYFFKLYALDSKLSLKAAPTKAEVEKAMQGHILGQGELVGRYRR